MDIDIYFCLVLSRQCGRKNTTQMDAKLGITVLANDLDKALRLKYFNLKCIKHFNTLKKLKMIHVCTLRLRTSVLCCPCVHSTRQRQQCRPFNSVGLEHWKYLL